MKKTVFGIVSVMLSLVLVFGTSIPAFASSSRVVESDDEIAVLVDSFNTAVNDIKSERPYAVLNNTSGVPEDGIVKTDGSTTEALDEEITKYLIPVLDGLFKGNSSVTKSFIATLLGDDTVLNFDKVELHRGTLRNTLVPIYGKDYVSALAPANDYQMIVFENENKKAPEEILITLPGGIQLKDAASTSYPMLFSLPSGNIDPVILSGADTETSDLLKDVKFTEFELGKAAVRVALDENGRVTRYRSQIDYNFKITFADMMKIMTAVLKINFLDIGISLANTILINLGKEGVRAEDYLESSELSVTYTAAIEITDFNWEPRYFGDINDDGKVDASDSRTALRHSVGLEFIKSSADQIYADVNFDGEINSADARLILRMSVLLDPLFSEVPDGKEILIAAIEEDPEEIPVEDEDPEEDTPEVEMPDLSFLESMPADTAQMVFDAINSFEGLAGSLKGGIVVWIAAIQNIVNAARG